MYSVTKRDGKIVGFDIKKISDAIILAFDACEKNYNQDIIDFLALKVTAEFEPKIENQAISRAYRMGQVRDVLVYRLLSDETVDERMLEILRNKQVAFDSFADKSVVGEESLELEETEIILKDDLPFAFPEFEPYIGQCKFTSCLHVKDKGCRIVEAVEAGKIPVSRHESYCAMMEQAKEIKEWELGKLRNKSNENLRR